MNKDVVGAKVRPPLGMTLCWGLMVVGGVVALAIPIVMMFVVGPWLFPTLYFSLVVGLAAIARGAARETVGLRRTAALQLANMVALDPANVVFAAMEYALIRTARVQEYLNAVGEARRLRHGDQSSDSSSLKSCSAA